MTQDQEFITELKAIIAQDVNKVKLDEIRPGDYTVEGMMRDNGITKSHARRVLNNLVEHGYFIKVPVRNPHGGGAMSAYRPVPTGGKGE